MSGRVRATAAAASAPLHSPTTVTSASSSSSMAHQAAGQRLVVDDQHAQRLAHDTSLHGSVIRAVTTPSHSHQLEVSARSP